jgi:D-alanyl-D-alanine carboxypeptidase/D-alanyl-D-alanine-endopeptidase (penicillin-binding protein 4)
MTPASTAKIVTSAAALAVLGANATFTTRVVHGTTPDRIVVVGGGDPTLAVNQFPARDYPQPATLASLAAATARALKSQGRTKVSVGFDTSLYTGPDLAPGWPENYVTTGNVTPIVSLEVDQGRLTAAGTPQDSDDPYNLRPRTTDPAGMAAASFAALLAGDGIHVTGSPVAQAAPAHASGIASVSSPPLSAIVDQMLEESNNVIAENLARQVALATGQPASFSGAASAAACTWWTAAACPRKTRSRRARWSRWSRSPPLTPGCAPCWPACRWPAFPARCRPGRACSAESAARPSARSGPRPATSAR